MTDNDLEGLEKELLALASLEPGWYANVGARTGERCCKAMSQAAEALSRLRAERDEVESWCEMHRQDRIHAENSRYAYLQAFRASEKQIRLLREALEPALADLRHAYTHLKAERVKRQAELADGLLSPAIARIERALRLQPEGEKG